MKLTQLLLQSRDFNGLEILKHPTTSELRTSLDWAEQGGANDVDTSNYRIWEVNEIKWHYERLIKVA